VDNELEVIRHQMEETRSSLADKLGELESQVRGAVEGATNLVADTAETVQETVHNVSDTVQETAHNLAEALDLSKQVEQHPWGMMAGAVGVGFVGGMILGSTNGVSTLAGTAASLNGAARPGPAPEPGPLHGALQMLKGMAVGALMGAVRDAVVKAVPDEYTSDLTKWVDDLTTQLGGKPLHASPEANLGRNI